ESHLSNNMSAANISTVRRDIKTLILTAPERMAAYHGTENTQEKLYNLSQHTLVEGVVIDVLATSTVAAAYAQWDAAPQNQRHARAVSHAIKQLIVQYADDYPQLENVVIVGGDPTIPYYRLYDKSRSKLTERKYMHQRPSILDTTVGQALKRNQILTDDFYTDLQPTNVHTPFYNRTLYLPDLAIGRLVETPAEIGTTIDTFLANDGIITLDTAAVVGDAKLADDWRHQQCDILTNTGFSAPFCTIDGTRYQEALLTDSYQWNMSASHSDYHVLDGRIFASDIVRNQTLNNTLATMYGCHAGLNVMGDGQKLDMAQAFAGRGATYIGSTVYTYGGMKSFTAPYHEISLYTEELGLAFSRRVQNGAPTVGDALRQAKWHYHTVSANAFSYLDEKVMLGMTLYGLPMTRLSTPTTQRAYQPVSYSSTDLPFQFNHNLVSAGYGNHFNTTTVDGSPLGKIAKHGFPIQPQYAVELQTTDNGATLRAVLLNGAAYDSYHNFDPIIAEAVGFNSISTSLYEMQAQFEGYDFQLPYHLSYLIGQTQILTDDQATLVLTLGRYDTDLSQEIVFNEIAIEPLYSSSEDITPPQLVTTTAVTSHKNATFDVQAIDNISVTQVILIADDGEGIWHPVHLTLGGDGWEGKLTSSVSQYYVQVVDGGNNVYTSDWFTPTFGIVSAVSLSSLDSSAPISQLWLFLLLFIGLLVITSKLQWMIRLQKSGKMQRR
ncbi:MAG: C25 family cysteine peptidase, partial [Candidatus Promineifilaceae bacterium]